MVIRTTVFDICDMYRSAMRWHGYDYQKQEDNYEILRSAQDKLRMTTLVLCSAYPVPPNDCEKAARGVKYR